MSTNGRSAALKLQFGLINHENRYLTAEAFGFKINASGNSMKKKQIWTLEQDPDSQVVFLRSHLGRYLSSDKDGKTIGESELWALHLALHPQANLLSVARKRYAHLSTQEDEISMDSNIPWGVDSLITLVYLEGKYSLKTCDNRFLRNDGKLVMEHGPNTSFTLELKSGKLAFKDCEGKYLSPNGPTGTLKSGRCTRPGKDELFDLEESHPQVVFQAANKRYVSIRQGVCISANQDDETDMETFQMEIDKETKKCMFRTNGGNYWTLVTHGGILSSATEIEENTMFDIEWLGRRIALKASNGKYVCTKKNGQLAAVSDSLGEDEQFVLKLINRPILVLRGENGFVCHHKNSNTLHGSRSFYDIFTLLFSDGGYQIKSGNQKFWYVSSSGLVCTDGDKPEDFFFEFVEYGRVGIKAQNGKYLRGDQGGTLMGDGLSVNASSLWEH